MAWTVTGNLKGPSGTLEVGTVTTGIAGSNAAVTNSGTASTATLNFVIPRGDPGSPGADGKSVSIKDTVATYSALPTGLTSANAGDGYFVTADGKLYVWSGTAFPANGAGIVIQGPPGTSATVALGTVATGAAGTNAVITNSGSSSAATFNFTIPKGDPGAGGTAATIAVGTVTTGAAGSAAAVTNIGSSSAAVFDIKIPKGADGNDGARGTKLFFGTGAPGSIPGSAVGDGYLDTVSGTLYQL